MTKRIFKPNARNHPHGIAIDARYVYWLSQPMGAVGEGYHGNVVATLHRFDRQTTRGRPGPTLATCISAQRTVTASA